MLMVNKIEFKPEIGKQFTVSDGELLLTLTVCEDGWYAVESPMEPQLITQGKSIEECFYMARDAIDGLKEVREQYRDAINEIMTTSSA